MDCPSPQSALASVYEYSRSLIWQGWLLVPIRQASGIYRFAAYNPNSGEKQLMSEQVFKTPVEALQSAMLLISQQTSPDGAAGDCVAQVVL
jgi:hypothetical protein